MIRTTRLWQHSKTAWTSARRLRLLHASPPPPPLAAAPHAPPLNSITCRSSCSLWRLYSSGSSASMVDDSVGGKLVIVDVPLAQTGEGIAECEILKWFVHEGDQVDEYQPLCEVQSDKATIEITSRYNGKVEQLLFVPGDIVKVGETLLKMAVEGSPSSPTVSDVLQNKELEASDGMQRTVSLSSESKNISEVLSTPAVRSLAKQYGVNINEVPGTGVQGRVLKEDVLQYATEKGIIEEESSASFSLTPPQQSKRLDEDPGIAVKYDWHHGDTTILLRGYQRAMVKSMSMAAKIPHFYYVDEINCDEIVNLKTSFQNNNTDPAVKHTFLPTLVKSLSVALSNYPSMNSCFNEETLEVTLKGAHNIGIAMATPNGLVVPNIKNVQSLSVFEITKELSRLQKAALDNKLNPDDISGGTITLSNIGAIGGKFGSPLVNLPEVSIIAIGRIQRLVQFADDGDVYPASVMTVNIGADHRVLDGATVAKFCNEWKKYIENPELLMLQMR